MGKRGIGQVANLSVIFSKSGEMFRHQSGYQNEEGIGLPRRNLYRRNKGYESVLSQCWKQAAYPSLGAA